MPVHSAAMATALKLTDAQRLEELHEAAKGGDLARINALVAVGVLPDTVLNEYGHSAAYVALLHSRMSAVERLISFGASTSLQAHGGTSLAQAAAARGWLQQDVHCQHKGWRQGHQLGDLISNGTYGCTQGQAGIVFTNNPSARVCVEANARAGRFCRHTPNPSHSRQQDAAADTTALLSAELGTSNTSRLQIADASETCRPAGQITTRIPHDGDPNPPTPYPKTCQPAVANIETTTLIAHDSDHPGAGSFIIVRRL